VTYPNPDYDPRYTSEPSTVLGDALRLVLLFHAGGPWDAERQREWLRITGTTEATTKVLCDHIRAALALADETAPGPL
jgi:hypothetical protein